MSFKLLLISSLYVPFIENFYRNNPSISSKSYSEQYSIILQSTSEPVGSQSAEYIKKGINTCCIIENVAPLQNAWAMEHGFIGLKGRKLVFEQIKMFRPDVILIDDVSSIDREWLNQIRNEIRELRLIAISSCAPYNSTIVEKFKAADFLITCTPGLKSEFESVGLKSFLVYHGFNPEVLKYCKPYGESQKNDLVFSGSLFQGGGFHNERLQLIESIIDKGFDLKIYGNLEKSSKVRAKQSVYFAIKFLNEIGLGEWVSRIPFIGRHEEYGSTPIKMYSKKLLQSVYPPVFGAEMFQLLFNSKIVLNNHGAVAKNFAGNVRLFEATGVGCCLLTDRKDNMSELFDLDNEVVVYDSFEDCIEKIRWLMNNEEKRAKIASNGQKRTLLDHCVSNRCSQIIDIINKELSK